MTIAMCFHIITYMTDQPVGKTKGVKYAIEIQWQQQMAAAEDKVEAGKNEIDKQIAALEGKEEELANALVGVTQGMEAIDKQLARGGFG